MRSTARIALVPRDGFFCKDGRGWHTSASGRGHGLDWPWPSTIVGALRTVWGRNEEARSGISLSADDWRTSKGTLRLGATIPLRRWPGQPWRFDDTVWPVPADALWLDGCADVHRLNPSVSVAPTLGRDDDPVREMLWRPHLPEGGKALPPPRWWPASEMVAWLSGEPVAVRRDRLALSPARRLQVHVGIRPEELTADEGVLFAHDVVETLDLEGEWAIAAEVEVEGSQLAGPATLGADARLARTESVPAQLFEVPERLLEVFSSAQPHGLRVVAVTPLSFERGWLPDGFVAEGKDYRGRLPGLDADLVLRAALVPRPIPVSGWDLAARQPKPVSRMVAPGAVYFLQRTDGRAFGELEARTLWLAAIGTRTDEGFGRVVPAVWDPSGGTP